MTQQVYISDTNIWINFRNAGLLDALFGLMQAHNNSSLADVSCYQLARLTKHPLLTGDGRLRKQAKTDGMQVHGALWLLDQMLVHQIIQPKNAAKRLQSMLASGARLPEADCQKRLTLWTA